jgi:hypothetical protein
MNGANLAVGKDSANATRVLRTDTAGRVIATLDPTASPAATLTQATKVCPGGTAVPVAAVSAVRCYLEAPAANRLDVLHGIGASPVFRLGPGAGFMLPLNGSRPYDLSGYSLQTDFVPIGTATRARAANVATLTTVGSHALLTGDSVKITGVGGVGYNTTAVTITRIDDTTFTYPSVAADEAPVVDVGGEATLNQTVNELYET